MVSSQPRQVLTTRCAVVGHPVSHSLSPALHRAGYAELGLEWSYEAIDVSPGNLVSFVAQLDPQVWRGLSVTMPHKHAAARLGRPDEVASLLGVANTLVFGDELTSHNTDVAGFVWALGRHGVTALDTALIFGAGATAQSALLGVAQLGASRVVLAVRDTSRAGAATRLASELGLTCEAIALADPLPNCDVLISTIPADSVPAHRTAGLAPVVFDVIYHPWPTPIAISSQAAGTKLISGLDLLVGQALTQFTLFTGETVAPETFDSAGRNELARRLHQLEG